MESICDAANIYFGTFIPIEKADCTGEDNPESILLAKTMFDSVSKETKYVINMILDAPDECFFKDGRVRKHWLRKEIKDNLKLSHKVMKEIEKEIIQLLKNP
jgi:hypothetical protein